MVALEQFKYSVFTDIVKKDGLNEKPEHSTNTADEENSNTFDYNEEPSTF